MHPKSQICSLLARNDQWNQRKSGPVQYMQRILEQATERTTYSMTYKITTRTLKMVAQDLFTVAHTYYLVTMDYYPCSDYWEMDCVLDTTSQTVIECATKAHFVRHGIPETVITDNGPQFISRVWEICNRVRVPTHHHFSLPQPE